MRKPSPAMVVACAALFVALTGSAVAAVLVSGDSLIAKHSLSGNRLRDHSVTGTQVKSSSLGKVPAAHVADAAAVASTASFAGVATNANHATSADTATKANGLPALTWVPLSLINGWSDYNNDPARTPAIAVDAQGIVHFRGAIRNLGVFTPEFAVIPSALRPSVALWLTADTFGATTGRIDLGTAGDASADDPTATHNSAGFTSLDGITYPLG
jgi:hypothetical protein